MTTNDWINKLEIGSGAPVTFYADEQQEYMSDAIQCAWAWYRTKQGDAYWRTAYGELVNNNS